MTRRTRHTTRRFGAGALVLTTFASALTFGAGVAAAAETPRASTESPEFPLVWKESASKYWTLSDTTPVSTGSLAEAQRIGRSLTYDYAKKTLTAGGQCLRVSQFSTPVVGDFWLQKCDGTAYERWETDSTGRIYSSATMYQGYRPGAVASTVGGKRFALVRGSGWELVSGIPRFFGRADSIDVEHRTAMISGYATPGADVVIDDRQQVRAAADGSWSAQVDGLVFGRNTVRLEQVVNGASTGTASFDVTLPLTALTARATFPADILKRVVLSGTAHTGATVIVRADGRQVATTTAANGTWSLELDAPNTGGVYALTIEQVVDGIGRGQQALTVDYGVAVIITTPTDGTAHAGGALRVQGRGQPGTTVEVGVGGPTARATVLANGAWSATVPDVDAREHRLTATARSKGANTTTSSVTVNPGQGGVPAPTADVVFGPTVGDRARIEGTAQAGATVAVRDAAGVVLGTPQVQEGRYSLTVPSPGPGVHEFRVTQTVDDDTSEPVVVTGDFGAPVALAPLPGHVTPGTRSITGTGADGAEVVVQVGNERRTATVANGRWSVDVELRPGTTSVEVSVTQTARGATVTRDTASTVADGAIAARPVTIDEPSSHRYVPNASTAVSGTATPYASVRIDTVRDHLIAEVRADEHGRWAFDRVFGPSNVYTLVATQARLDGSTSTSGSFVLSPVGAFRPLTVTSHPDGTYTPGENTFRGTATPDAIVTATNQWGTALFTAQADPATGAWRAVRNLGPSATYEVTFVQTAPNGQGDQVTRTLRPDVAPWVPATLTSPVSGTTYRPGPVTFTGTGTEGTTVVATDQRGVRLGEATVALGTTTWSFRRELGPTADYRITFVATRGTDTNTFTASLDAPRYAPVVITSHAPGDTYTPGRTTTFRGTASPYATIDVTTRRGGPIATATADSRGAWSFSRSFGPSNVYEMLFAQTDVYGAVRDTAEFDYAPDPGE